LSAAISEVHLSDRKPTLAGYEVLRGEHRVFFASIEVRLGVRRVTDLSRRTRR